MLKALKIGLATILFGTVVLAQQKNARPLWVDFDFETIAEPKARPGGYYSSFFTSEFTGQWKKYTDPTNLFAKRPSPAPNVNTFDEVPDSSWFTNRHGLRPMSPADLVRGPNSGHPPDLSRGIIKKVKNEGVSPGLLLTDNKGQAYLIKFDHKDYPELQSAAEVISTKLLFAAGYNVPENYVGYLNADNLEIGPDVEVGRGKKKRAFAPDDLSKMLEDAARQPDGTYRVLASKMLKGIPKGPFPFIGVRSDDPNDLIPHENRRDLRGLRVFASWINHWDMKEPNTLDMYTEEGGRKFLRHYLIDFGATMGGGSIPTEYYHGREYSFDQGSIVKELFTLGAFESADEKIRPITYPAVGLFTADDFDPGRYRTSFHVPPFDNMTREDAFWATRILMSFSDEDLRVIVSTGEYSDPQVSMQIIEILRARREAIARHWLGQVNPIARFSVKSEPEGLVLRFEDLMTVNSLAGPAEYSYAVSDAAQPSSSRMKSGANPPNPPNRLSGNRIVLGDSNESRCVQIWTSRDRPSKPTTVCMGSDAAGVYRIVSIDRE